MYDNAKNDESQPAALTLPDNRIYFSGKATPAMPIPVMARKTARQSPANER